LIALKREVALPPRAALAALLGLLALATLQTIPIGHAGVAALSPRAESLRQGLDPAPRATLSLAPRATASALRTGAALAGILLVTTSVVASRGAARIALAASVSAAFQGLYGLLVLASGHERIWNVPKTAYLDSATGTFVNKNHFAGFLAATIPLGVGLVVVAARKARDLTRRKGGLLLAFGPAGTRALLLALLTLPALGGLLLSFSRAGIALGVAATAATAVAALSGKAVHRAAAIVLVIAIAAVPLADLGADRLMARYASSGSDLNAAGGRATVWLGTLEMIGAFPIGGCGFGSYTWVFPAFSDPEVRLHYTHAHNDLLQLGAEGGLGAVLLFGLLLVSLARAGVRALSVARDPLVIGAAAGLTALLLHALVDFDFHIPADAALAAVLGGVIFGASWNARS
jgi:O-antigen ligase